MLNLISSLNLLQGFFSQNQKMPTPASHLTYCFGMLCSLEDACSFIYLRKMDGSIKVTLAEKLLL